VKYRNYVTLFVMITTILLLGPESQYAHSQKVSLSFLNPQDGAVVNSGETLLVEITGLGLQEVILVAPNFANTVNDDGTGLFTFHYLIPIDTIGDIGLMALGKTSAGPLIKKNGSVPQMPSLAEITITVKANTNAIKINSLRVISDSMYLRVGESRQIMVLGKLEDGGEINITSSQFGTQYITNIDYVNKYSPAADRGKFEIIRVDSNGKVTAVNKGEDSIIVSHKDATADNIRVIVE